eukprot:6539491-Pyramimonas_sp.AAC.1
MMMMMMMMMVMMTRRRRRRRRRDKEDWGGTLGGLMVILSFWRRVGDGAQNWPRAWSTRCRGTPDSARSGQCHSRCAAGAEEDDEEDED